MSTEPLNVSVKTRITIKDITKNKILLDKSNAIHPQNVSRIIRRALSHEPNSYAYRLAFGNGGAFKTVTGQTVLKTPNDGTDGSGWESRLYNETYSEVIDGSSSSVGTDPGSADANNIRTGGGADPTNDPAQDSVVSQEVGTKSNVVITCYLNENEPSGQLSSISSSSVSSASQDFIFNELGIYSSGLSAIATSGFSTVNVGNKTSTDISTLAPSSVLILNMTIDGVTKSVQINVPPSGTGPLGQITYGDICEGINTGSWLGTGDAINNDVFVYITDYSNGTYTSILNYQSYGLLTFQSKTTGTTSTILLTCGATNSDFFNALSGGICGNVNYTTQSGNIAGVQNDPINPENERERLLTHLIFDNLTKRADSTLEIIYTLTISVAPTVSSNTSITSNT